MDVTPGQIVQRYYELNPLSSHATGDIWMGLPTYGLLGTPTCSGIVVTPCCDLAHSKADTVTYLPVLAIANYVLTPAFYGNMRSCLAELLGQLGIMDVGPALPRGSLPGASDIVVFEELLAGTQSRRKTARSRELTARCRIGLAYLRRLLGMGGQPAESIDFARFFGRKRWEAMRGDMVSNSFRPDTHFLPADGQDRDWSAIQAPSLALLRYPLTVSIQVLDAANVTPSADWMEALETLKPAVPNAGAFSDIRPLKTLRLRERFLVDLLTRFVGLYVRIGSPDFSPYAIHELISDIGEGI